MVQTCIETAASVRADADAGVFNGEPFVIAKTYPSIADMEADEGGDVAAGQYVVIDAGTVNDEDNAKLYQRTADGWKFVVDMSGASGTIEGLADAGTAGYVLTKTNDGFAWQPVFPESGTTGQVLTKTESGGEWQNAPDGLPEGGEVGQVLTKTESGAEWSAASAEVEYPVSLEHGGTGAEDAAAARTNLDVYSKAEVDAKNTANRAGFIYVNPSETLPDGFLWCDGAAVSRTEYPELFAAIGTHYGAGDGLTTFNVPDLQTRVPVGAGDGYALGDQGGEAEHTLTVDEMPSHKHRWRGNISSSNVVEGTSYAVALFGSDYSDQFQDADKGGQAAGGDQPHNNMQPYTVVNYIIATGKGSGVSVADIVQGASAIPLEVEYGGTGATDRVTALANLGITFGTDDPPATGTPNTIYIQISS